MQITGYNKSWSHKKTFYQLIGKNFRDYFLGKRDDIVAKEILSLIRKNKNKKIHLLDIGSGPHAIVAKKILSLSKKNEILSIDCYDFYSEEIIKKFNNTNKKIKLFKNSDLIKNNKKYDYCMFIDVLHHIGITTKLINTVFRTAKKKAKFVIIKDHFQKNFFDKILLTIMDYVGNLKDNTKVIYEYYTEKIFNNFLHKHSLSILYLKKDISYYYNYLFFFKKKSLHFIGLFKVNST
jgi:ubiquinone/menaquinone biosynthesis C-methylase UbiE